MRDIYREKFLNNSREYLEKLKKRQESAIMQYTTPIFRHAEIDEYQYLDFVTHVWKTGDKFFKLSNTHYQDSSYWWVIALFNQKPTEAHCKMGAELYIPVPLSRVLSFIGYE